MDSKHLDILKIIMYIKLEALMAEAYGEDGLFVPNFSNVCIVAYTLNSNCKS